MAYMLRYLVVRLLSSLPAILLGLIGLFIFRLLPSQSVWEERIELLAIESGSYDSRRIQAEKTKIRKQLGVDLPIFYFTIQSAALPTTTPPAFSQLQSDWARHVSLCSGMPKQSGELASALQATSFTSWQVAAGRQPLGALEEWLASQSPGKFPEIRKLAGELATSELSWRSYIPALSWNGVANQFHLWFSQLLTGNLGASWKNHEPVSSVIARALSNTVVFTVPALLLIFVSAYWLVIGLSAVGPRLKSASDQLIYLLDLIPLFGWAILTMILFASGTVFSWFPSHASASTLNGQSVWSRSIHPYILPAFILWIGTFPFVTKHIDNAFQKSAQLPFVFMAHARGLGQQTIKRKYRLRYSLLPAITLLGEYLLAVVSGALVVEVLFSIQGVGMLLMDAVNAQDYPVVTGVMLFLILMRAFSFLITDLLYYLFDPRIRFASK